MGKRNPGGARDGFFKRLKSFNPFIDNILEIIPIINGIRILIIRGLLTLFFKLSPLHIIIIKKNYAHYCG